MSPSKTVILNSTSEQETREIAGRLLLKNWNKTNNGLIIALDGNLGTGKTIFTKGVAEFLKIKEIIKSPTYSYIEEYDYHRHHTMGKLYHLDMWKIDNKEVYERLKIKSLLGKNNIIVIEWFNQIANFMTPILKTTDVIQIYFNDASVNNQSNRELKITEKYISK